MISVGFRPVRHKLELLLVFDQRAIATGNTKSIAKGIRILVILTVKIELAKS